MNDIAVIQPVTPMMLIERAQTANASIEQMQQLFELQLQWEGNEAKKAYFRAIALFKSESVDIIKNKKVKYTTSKGTTEYSHAELGQIVNTVTPLLSKHGLSHHWEYSQDSGKIRVTCFLTHDMGFEKSTSLEAAADDSGGKNSIQAIGSTTSYLERYTFLAMTGLASREQDDDGRGAGKQAVMDVISDDQFNSLMDVMTEVKADQKGFCAYFKIPEIADLPAKKYDYAMKMMAAKRSK